jgi:hypothetical protein
LPVSLYGCETWVAILRGKLRIKAFETEAKRQIETGEEIYGITSLNIRNLFTMLPELPKKEKDIGVILGG